MTNIANTGTTQNYSNLTQNTEYRAIVQSGSCASATATSATITIAVPSEAGSISGATTVCATGNSGVLNLINNTGAVIRWESSIDNFTTTTTIANTTTTQNYTNLAANKQYRAVVQILTCPSATTSVAEMIVSAATVAGAVSADTTVCPGNNSGTLILTGQTGAVHHWESSTHEFSSTANIVIIANTTAQQSFQNIAESTKFRAIVQSPSCAAENAAPALVAMAPAADAGTVSDDINICGTVNSGSITLSKYVGTISNWESSIDGFNTAQNIVFTGNTYNFNNLTNSTQFRAVVNSQGCSSSTSAMASVNISRDTDAGTISADTAVCQFSNSGLLKLTGSTGTVQNWESSSDGFATIKNISSNSTTLPFSNLAESTQYRAVVKSGTCPALISPSVMVTVDVPTVGGKVSTSANVCKNGNSGTLTLSGYTGSILTWKSSIDNFTTTTEIPNTSTTQNYENLTITTKFRALIKSGACLFVHSDFALISVDSLSKGGVIKGDAKVCPLLNSGTLSLENELGSILQWESSTDHFLTSTVIDNNNENYDFENVHQTTEFRALVQSGDCPAVYSNPATVSIDPNIVLPAFEVLKDTLICEGTTFVIRAKSGFSNYQWQDDTKGSSYTVSQAGTYTVSAKTKEGCLVSDTAVIATCDIQFIPNVITPNGDGTNDQFVIQGLLENSSLSIYNRWGILLYHSDHYDNTWDGGVAIDGTYYYVLNNIAHAALSGYIQIIK